MSSKLIPVIVAILFVFYFCRSENSRVQSESNLNWYRGNTHTHAQFSDENESNDVPVIAKWYKDAGYDFLVLSEHNDHVMVKKVFCHDEASDLPGFLMICGLELSNSRHHSAIGINYYIGDEISLKDGVEKIVAAGGIPILNHPRDPVVTASDFIATEGLNHLEIINGGRPGDTPATELLWDSIMSATDGRIVYGVGSDDNHYKEANVGRGWIMVKSPALTKADIMESLRKGDFYATTGVLLTDYKVTNRRVDIESQNGDTIIFTGRSGKVLKTVADSKARYNIRGDEYYVRAKITNADGKAAWTQPVLIKP